MGAETECHSSLPRPQWNIKSIPLNRYVKGLSIDIKCVYVNERVTLSCFGEFKICIFDKQFLNRHISLNVS